MLISGELKSKYQDRESRDHRESGVVEDQDKGRQDGARETQQKLLLPWCTDTNEPSLFAEECGVDESHQQQADLELASWYERSLGASAEEACRAPQVHHIPWVTKLNQRQATNLRSMSLRMWCRVRPSSFSVLLYENQLDLRHEPPNVGYHQRNPAPRQRVWLRYDPDFRHSSKRCSQSFWESDGIEKGVEVFLEHSEAAANRLTAEDARTERSDGWDARRLGERWATTVNRKLVESRWYRVWDEAESSIEEITNIQRPIFHGLSDQERSLSVVVVKVNGRSSRRTYCCQVNHAKRITRGWWLELLTSKTGRYPHWNDWIREKPRSQEAAVEHRRRLRAVEQPIREIVYDEQGQVTWWKTGYINWEKCLSIIYQLEERAFEAIRFCLARYWEPAAVGAHRRLVGYAERLESTETWAMANRPAAGGQARAGAKEPPARGPTSQIFRWNTKAG